MGLKLSKNDYSRAKAIFGRHIIKHDINAVPIDSRNSSVHLDNSDATK